jgi:hypothetical protein
VTRASVCTATVCLTLVAPAAVTARPYDFDGDRRQEAIVPAPGWSPGGAPNAGAVFVLPRPGRGIATRATILSEGAAGVSGTPEGDDAFGAWTAGADFNGDRLSDLAVAAPGDGVTTVIPGSPSGLAPAAAYAVPVVGPLAAGDLNRDGYGDLLVGQPFAGSAPGDESPSGTVSLFLGSRTGIPAARNRSLSRPRARDVGFGSVLALGDVEGDGHLDLLEAAQGHTDDIDFSGVPGHVSYCPGSPAGPLRCRALGPGLHGGPTALAVADVDGDRHRDVLAGIPINAYIGEDDAAPAGAVRIWLGTDAGPGRRSMEITQRDPDVPGRDEPGDLFGWTVAAGHLDADRNADVVIGAPGEDAARGSVTVLHGRSRTPRRVAGHTVAQGRGIVPGPRRKNNAFGSALALLDLDGDGDPELLIGAPGDRSITILRTGRPRSLAAAGVVTPAALGLRVPPEPPDALPGFGALLGQPTDG